MAEHFVLEFDVFETNEQARRTDWLLQGPITSRCMWGWPLPPTRSFYTGLVSIRPRPQSNAQRRFLLTRYEIFYILWFMLQRWFRNGWTTLEWGQGVGLQTEQSICWIVVRTGGVHGGAMLWLTEHEGADVKVFVSDATIQLRGRVESGHQCARAVVQY